MAEAVRRLVVGVDGSEDSKLALRWAIDYARAFGGEVEAVAAPEMIISATIHDAYTEEDYVRDTEERLTKTLAEVVAPDAGVTVTPKVVRGLAARALPKAAMGADMLVIGSHGEGELPGMHLGSTASYCVHHAPCPVVVLRSQVL